MKLAEHVDKIRDLIHKSFSNYFARLGITAKKQLDIEEILEEQKLKRKKLDRIFKNHIGETGSFAAAYEKAIDEYTFTLFNRIAAIKVMEAHMMFPEVITKRSEQGNRSFAHRAWLEQNKDMAREELEGIREFIKFEFNKLGEKIPLYDKGYHYALLPYVIELNEIIDAFNEVEKDPDVDDNIWQSDDILGWFYESYNNVKKEEHKASGKKTEYDKVSLQSQVYTPRWVVKFLVDNSLGKLYLEMYPDSEIKERYKIANAPDTPIRDEKPLHEVKIVDPATGSGNFLYYAFDLFYDLYMDQIDNYGADYDEDDLPKLILENNLYGIDIDERAVQIAQLGLFIKAMRKNRDVYIEQFNVVSSDFFMPDYTEVDDIFELERLDKETRELIKETWADLQVAYKFGSLVKIEERVNRKISEIKKIAERTSFGLDGLIKKWENWKETVIPQIYKAVDENAIKTGDTFLGIKTKDALTFLTVLTTKYDVAVANPPYTDSADFGPKLKKFIDSNYRIKRKFNRNLYSAFFKRITELVSDQGLIGMVTPMTFMFIKKFEDMRKIILENFSINIFIQFGFGGMFAFSVDPALFILQKGLSNNKSAFIKLDKYFSGNKKKFMENTLLNYYHNRGDKFLYEINQNDFKKIESCPFIYWISRVFRQKFSEMPLEKVLKICQGLATSNNVRFLRYWWEIDINDISENFKKDHKKWVPYAKGGTFNKWYGNLWLTVNWENSGYEIKEYVKEKYRKTEYAKGFTKERWDKLIRIWVVKNENFYFKEGITYSASGRGGYAFRYLPPNHIFDVGGSSIFHISDFNNIYYSIAFLNSRLSFYIADCLNPTANIQVGDIKRIPFKYPPTEIEKDVALLAKRNIKITKHLNKFILIEREYKNNALVWEKNNYLFNLESKINLFINYQNHFLCQILLNEALINEKIFVAYDLSPDDKSMIVEKEGEPVGNLPVLPEAKKAYFNEEIATEEFALANIRDYIEKLPEKAFAPEEKNSIIDGFTMLYQGNNNLEEFCIRNQVNPINVWYWFKESNVIPKQRMNDIAMEFLAGLIREILMEDENGIAPLVRIPGEEILIDRIEKKFIEKGFSSAQFSQFDEVLSRELNDYLNNHFFKAFSDHLNMFMYLPKTPFIWHLTSGPIQGFDAYIIIYKWNRDRLFSLKSVYIEKRETALRNRQSDLQNNDSAEAQNEKDLIFKQLKEIENLKTKIDELLAEGYDPVLDDGVGKNIAPLQKKGIISYDVLNKGQLKKYLNADW